MMINKESNAIDDVAVIEERNVVNDVVAVIETPGFRGTSLSVSTD